MALPRKASPSVILLGLRAVGIGSSTTIKSRMNNVFRQGQSQSRNLSSVGNADKDLVDATLVKVLKYGISSAKSNLKISQVKTPIDTFPFECEEDDCSSFKRKFPDGELIRVITYLQRHYDHDCEDDKVRDERKNDMKTPPAFPMFVTVWNPRKRDKWLHFDITVSEEDIIVHNYSLNSPEIKLQESDYKLQQSLSKYLEERGIKSIASFLINNKRYEEAKEIHLLSFMKHLKKIIQK